MIGRADYEERREARIERLGNRADNVRAAGESRIAGARRIADGIPLGQPILVGHHSERHARKDAERIHNGFSKGFAAIKEADDLDRRAVAAEENRAISSDDPNAIEKLREKLAEMEAERDGYKAVNAAYRKGGAAAVVALVGEEAARAIVHAHRFSHDPKPVPGYRITNLGANIRRVKERIEVLEKQDAAPPKEAVEFGEIRVEEVDNRAAIFFPGKPADEVRAMLKSYGFKWSPMMGAWVRLMSNGAWYWACDIAQRAAGGAP